MEITGINSKFTEFILLSVVTLQQGWTSNKSAVKLNICISNRVVWINNFFVGKNVSCEHCLGLFCAFLLAGPFWDVYSSLKNIK